MQWETDLSSQTSASRGNLFSGDTDFVMNTASTITEMSRLKTSEFYAYFLHPYNLATPEKDSLI
ncbi:MAG TPA: hypothetical protein DEH22_05630 [Chloroflexi bacterium]|nr:hypothetical protein [Chloroflexota bacterium]